MLRLIAVVGWLLLVASSAGAEPVDAALASPTIDLMPALRPVQSLAPETAVELPQDGNGQKLTLPLKARGPGPVYRWAVFTLRNGEDVPQELVLAVPHQRLVGSGVLWPLPSGSRVLGIGASGGPSIEPLSGFAADSFALTVPARSSNSYAMELSLAGLDGATLWQRRTFDAAAWQSAFLGGLLLGVASLIGIAIASLMVVKPRALFAAGALFAWSAIAFLAIETGHGPSIVSRIRLPEPSEDVFRALVESLMLVGILTTFSSLVELRRRMPIAGAMFAGLAGVALALAVYGWFEPRIAAGIIRILFAAAVLAGLVIIFILWRSGFIRARASLPGWVVLTAWTALAGWGVVFHIPVLQPLVLAGLLVVLLTLGFTLAQFAFDRGIASSRFFEDAGRRALALAGSDQAVWDWQAGEGPLYIGPELERALGLEPGALAASNAESWLDLMHPADRAGYAATVEAAERRGRGSFSQTFRLRRVDGTYRWFLLRARAVPGEHGGAAGLIGTLCDVTAQRLSEDRLLADAVRDPVTGLPNRALFMDRLDQAIRRARERAAGGLHVVVMALDEFDSLRDALGNAVAEDLLKSTARRIGGLIGPEDTLARLSGDRLGLILHDPDATLDIIGLTAALRDAVSQPVMAEDEEVVVTASLGLASLQAEGRDAETLLEDAEIALHEARRRGEAVEFFSPDMREEASELLRRAEQLRAAVEGHAIEVIYRPVVRLASRELAGFEAAMRWRNGREVVAQEKLVKLAAECGLLHKLGRYALTDAGRYLGIWQRAFRPEQPLFVSVDIPAADMVAGDLVADVEAMIEREGIAAGTLTLELNHEALARSRERVRKVLQRLKRAGVALACDGYGIGDSDLSALAQLPLDIIKLGPAFLEVEGDDERHLLVLEAIVRLAHDLKLSVVAEGIESEEQLERLAEVGCDYGQGFHVGPPVTPKQVTEALADLPYTAGARGSTLTVLLERLFGRKGRGQAQTGAGRSGSPAPGTEHQPDVVLDVTGIMPSASGHRGAVPGSRGGAGP